VVMPAPGTVGGWTWVGESAAAAVATLTLAQNLLAVLAGAVVGFSLGLLGGGGSILAVPLLLYVVGVRAPHVVIGTTALAVSATAFWNLIPHARAHHVRWLPAAAFAVAGSAGALLGSTLGKRVGGEELLVLFGVLMLVVAGLMARPRAVRGDGPGAAAGAAVGSAVGRSAGAGVGAGLLSGFFGIGGGFLIVPGLILATGMSMIDAVGSSLLSVGAFGLTTALNYAGSGLVAWTLAGEYLVGGAVGGIFGERLATHLEHEKGVLNLIFSGVVAVVAVYMIVRSLAAMHLLRV
jgi:uncharacterized membrane protein YfcA